MTLKKCTFCLKKLDESNFYLQIGKIRSVCKICHHIPNKNMKKIKDNVSARKCTKCLQTLNINSFVRKQNKIDGVYYLNKCRKCNNKQTMIQRNTKHKDDKSFRLRKNISSAVSSALKKVNISKNRKSILDFLNYNINELKQHLELQFTLDSNLSWNGYGLYWHLDHIIPQSEFKYESMDCPEFIACWCLFNLRPLEAKQNMSDGGTKARHLTE